MKLTVKTIDNKDAGEITLDKDVFGLEVRQDILHRAVHYQLNKRRAGTHKTKGISEISGTGKKPWKQKGTGRARFGSLRAAQMRGGATIFGPVVRSHATELPKRVRRLALATALSAKATAKQIIILDAATAKDHKTKAMASACEKMGLSKALFICGEAVDGNFEKATRNLPNIDVLPIQGANVYDILRCETLVLTREAVEKLTERLKAA
ncbi:MAG: 50S ribosomal protein L4 [Pseudomonadota bacterium]